MVTKVMKDARVIAANNHAKTGDTLKSARSASSENAPSVA